MAIRDRIKDTVNKAASKAASGAANARGKKPSGGFGQGFGSGFGPGGFGQALEDLLSFAGDLRGQATDRMQGELEKLAAKLDLVTRREFEAVRAIAIAARMQAERLEAQLNGKAKQTTPAKKPVAKKAAPKTVAAKKPTKKR